MEDARPLLFVDDDARFLQDLRLVLDAPFVTARSCAEALALTEPPSVAFVDLGLPDGDGVELVRQLIARWPDVPMVVLTVARADERVLAAVNAGARGYLLKEDVGSRLPQAVQEALDGGAPMSPSIARKVLSLLAAQRPPTSAALPEGEPLTSRELAVLRELADGASYLQAAAALEVSINTVRAHVRGVYRKLAVGTKTEAVLMALRLGIVDSVESRR